MEEWKDIEGYEGLYQVSNYGRAKRLDSIVEDVNGKIRKIKSRILKLRINNFDHYRVALSKNGLVKDFFIHQLVAQAFIPNPNNYEVVHHLDHNTKNNIVDNLVWMSREEHDKLHQIDRTTASAKALSQTVYQYTLNGELVGIWSSAKQAARELGFSSGDINACCNGGVSIKGKWFNKYKYKGFIWKWEKDIHI